MEKTLHFIASYNSQIIQVGFGIVFLLIIIYVYRLFFMSGELNSGAALGSNTEAIEEKLNIIIDQQKNKVAAATSSPTTAVVGAGQEIEIDRLKAEIYNLHQQLKEATSNGAVLGPAEPSGAVSESSENISSEILEEKIKLEEKVKDLESRLSEYEIIADDIAELSQLRADNAKLIEQIGLLKAGPTTEIDVQPSLEDMVQMPPPEEAIPEEVMSNENLSAEESLAVNSEATMNEEDQNLMDDFAKTVLKKENQ